MERAADSGNILTNSFCESCGSLLSIQNSSRTRLRTVTIGTLDQPSLIEVNSHIWVKRKLPWVILPKHHRIFEEAGDWTKDYANDPTRYNP